MGTVLTRLGNKFTITLMKTCGVITVKVTLTFIGAPGNIQGILTGTGTTQTAQVSKYIISFKSACIWPLFLEYIERNRDHSA